jgi:hypothetical protein
MIAMDFIVTLVGASPLCGEYHDTCFPFSQLLVSRVTGQ